MAGDVRQTADCASIVAAAVEHFGGIDVLVNSAGVYFERALTDMTEAAFDDIMAVNVKGSYFMAKYAVPELQKRQGSSIVNLSSDAGLQGNYLCSAYCASKGAVTLFTRALALELAPWKIRVNCVCPGDIATPLTEAQLAAAPSRAEALREMSGVYPLGRIGTAEEAASVIVFLASPEAGFVTGAAWRVDRGITAREDRGNLLHDATEYVRMKCMQMWRRIVGGKADVEKKLSHRDGFYWFRPCKGR